MLESIYSLGKAHDNDDVSEGRNMTSLVTPARIKHVIGIIFQSNNGAVKYKNVQPYDFREPSWHYLFKRDYSGRPGLFLSGNVSRQDIQNLKILLGNPRLNSTKIQKFFDSKILWFQKGKLVNNQTLLKTLTPERKEEFTKIFQELKNNSSTIKNNVLDDLVKNESERTLVTIMIQYGTDDPKFPGQIEEYTGFFKRGVLAKKKNTHTVSTNDMICSVCNERKTIEPFIEKPLPFFVADKPMFFPNADQAQSIKGFPVCDDCYLELQNGTQFISDKLNYKIPSIGSKRPDLSFWLVPHLNDHELLIAFKNELNNRYLYLNKLKDLCETLKEISRSDPHESDNLKALLRFSALFYRMDSHALMRVTNYTQGIYPIQLQRLLDVKQDIDIRYPYQEISKLYNKQEFYVGLPLIVHFYKEVSMQWENQTVELLESMFTGQKIALDGVFENVMTKIRESSKSYNVMSFIRIVTLGMMLLEFLINLNLLLYKESKVVTEDQVQNEHSPTEEITNFQKFISNHSNILAGDVERAVFAVGICVGILLEVQAQRYNKTAPFWSRLNRLDLDLDRILPLFSDVKSKLAMYEEQHYNTIINYLGINEVSKMNTSSKLSKDIVNFIFSLGLSYGYMLKRGYIK